MVRGVPKPDLGMFAKLGIKADMQAQFMDQVEECQIVYEENWLSLSVFLAVQTQWRIVAGMSSASYTGLDYTAVQAAMHMMGISKKKNAEIFCDVRTLEITWLNETAASQQQQGQS